MPKAKLPFFTVLVLIGGYLFSRLQNLTSLPVFGDEAIYVRWAQLIKNVETLRFIPLTDGKQPLFMWISAAFLKFFNDPLFASRFVSVLAGFGSLVVIFIATCLVISFNSKHKNPIDYLKSSIYKHYNFGFIGSFLYLILPFSFFFDRMALADSLLSFFGILSLTLTLLISKFPRLDLAMILGIVIGLAWITKSPAIYFLVLSLVTFFFLTSRKTPLVLKTIYSSIFAVISFFIFNILRLGPQFHMIGLRNLDYVWKPSDIIGHPLDPLLPHLKDTVNIFSSYISPYLLFFFLILLVISVLKKSFSKTLFVVFAWFFLPLLANAAFAKVFTARYILFTIPPLIVLFSASVYYSKITFSNLLLAAILILSVPNILFISKLSMDSYSVKLPPTEEGYLQNWTSGWGIKDASEYLKSRALSSNVIVGTEGYFGTLPDGLQIYTDSIPQLTIIGVGLGFKQLPPQLVDAFNHGDEVYLLINKSRLELINSEISKLTLVKEYIKPVGDSLLLYRLGEFTL